ncbi:MAG: LPS export ABC transporter ATP-binding protein [Holosporaceae bacterium]|jgi:lipopolysaccharide export system ATP-binding protein|nr:LPS export ABC transporter ATP-binding protein [Holosporaceae bacterium]
MKDGIVCTNLSKTVSGRVVLRDVSIKAAKGSIVALLGPNGAGKTTSFAILCGLIKPDSGRILFNQRDITELPMYKRARMGIGYLPQESSIFRGLDVQQNIMAVLEMKHGDKNKRVEVLEKLLKDLTIDHIRSHPATNVSGGERRKLEIARALASSPSFMLLDEPFAGIDPIAIGEMKEMIFQLKAKNIGVIITDHDVRTTLPISDYAYILHEGTVLVEGKASEIIANDIAKKIYLGESFSAYNSPYGFKK